MNRKILLFAMFLLFLSGCKKNTELIIPYRITNQVIETMNNSREQGIYMITSSKEQLLIYRGLQKGIQTMSYTINDNTLTIYFETEEITQAKDYLYKITSSTLFDTILISVDGNNESFHTIFYND